MGKDSGPLAGAVVDLSARVSESDHWYKLAGVLLWQQIRPAYHVKYPD